MPLPYIIVPVYNGAFSLKEFLGRLHQQWLDRLVIVDDGSSDDHTKVFKDIRCYENGFQFESEFLIKAVLSGWKVQHIPIPTIYGNESSSMRHVRDTIKFIIMWLKSFFWI